MNQREMTRDLVAQIIPIILLGFYVFAVGTAVNSTLLAVRQCGTNAACADAFHSKRSDGVNLILNVVGGLVSALVVAELAVTNPGELPSAQLLKRRMTRSSKKLRTILSTAFIIVWILCGVISIVIYVLYPNETPSALSEFAKAWLGLALASAYSYLGIR
jgi:hypothetical protein